MLLNFVIGLIIGIILQHMYDVCHEDEDKDKNKFKKYMTIEGVTIDESEV